ncbi:YCII-related protein [Kribbella flavida DSM 17836]|uniref:YCII-related protein n=1 Tax=Kribbella flavida (strain DSM 17836 / JCM 10339 / NBRC 14399) TaxID=479435 RepID=D2PV42_KRIFD|nr:YciI family protein [Kribbella flavida]ADB33323.1 YCII-related protein [Kribbella flavida DSM 17836]
MKYMLLIRPDRDFDGPVPAEMIAATEAWVEEMTARGVRLHGDALRPASEATGVSRRDGRVVTTDGPFAEAKEQMGGYDLIECRDLDEAIEIAAKHPVAEIGMVEIRAVREIAG